jgi:hypothetical protein
MVINMSNPALISLLDHCHQIGSSTQLQRDDTQGLIPRVFFHLYFFHSIRFHYASLIWLAIYLDPLMTKNIKNSSV